MIWYFQFISESLNTRFTGKLATEWDLVPIDPDNQDFKGLC